VSVVLGVAMVAEALLALWFGWSRFGLNTNDSALYTFRESGRVRSVFPDA
jgi:H+-transporting ATPase